MYRPLVQPKLHTSRGQAVSPGISLLATGGPKQRGQLVVPNPHLLRNAEGWSGGSPGCAGLQFLDGRAQLSGFTGSCAPLSTTNLLGPTRAGQRYELWVSVKVTGGIFAGIYVDLGGDAVFLYTGPNGNRVTYHDIETPGTDVVELNIFDAADLDIIIDYLGISLVGEF